MESESSLSRTCVGCGSVQLRTAFSPSQLKKRKSEAACRACVASGAHLHRRAASASHPAHALCSPSSGPAQARESGRAVAADDVSAQALREAASNGHRVTAPGGKAMSPAASASQFHQSQSRQTLGGQGPVQARAGTSTPAWLQARAKIKALNGTPFSSTLEFSRGQATGKRERDGSSAAAPLASSAPVPRASADSTAKVVRRGDGSESAENGSRKKPRTNACAREEGKPACGDAADEGGGSRCETTGAEKRRRAKSRRARLAFGHPESIAKARARRWRSFPRAVNKHARQVGPCP